MIFNMLELLCIAEITWRFTQVITLFKFLSDILWCMFLCRHSWFLELCSCLCLLVLSLEFSKAWFLLSPLQQLVLPLASSSLSSLVDLWSSRFGPTSSSSSKIRFGKEKKQEKTNSFYPYFRFKQLGLRVWFIWLVTKFYRTEPK